jgi:uncharacterized protein (DUF1800 family)
MTSFRLYLVGFLSALALSHGVAQAQLATAVEFYNTNLKHYFLTAYAAEVTAVDTGSAGPGWRRTGGEFSVYLTAASNPNAKPVCRFYGTPGKGPNSHFYTVNADECAGVKKDPGWTYEGIAFYVLTPDAGGQCGAGQTKIYRSYNQGHVRNDANHRFTADPTAYERMPKQNYVPEGVMMCTPVADWEIEADIVRLLEQSTLGPTEALVQQVKAKGIPAWLDEQLAMNVTQYTQYPYWNPPQDQTQCIDDNTPPVTPEKYCVTNIYSAGPVAREFFRQSKTAPDQVRLRVAHLWHQLLIVGNFGQAYGHAEFHQRLRSTGLTTYEQLLNKYAISPQLGSFQNVIKNIPERDGIKPNENFGREVMQLFTTGLTELNDDGTPKLDAQGRLIPSYQQVDVDATARIFTGLTFPNKPGLNTGFWESEWAFTGDMRFFDEFHDKGEKRLFMGSSAGGVIFPYGGTARGEFDRLIKELVNRPSTPPFIVQQMIQKMVTSNPTPGYVKRVVEVFKNNGSGVRGDLKAVFKAILLDPEARGARKIDSTYGRLREPTLFWTSMIRALNVTTDGQQPYSLGWQSNMSLFNAPSIFAYYPADYVLAAQKLPAPEFGIFSTSEFLNRANQVNDLLYNNQQPYNAQWWGPQAYLANSTGTPSPDMAAFLPDVTDPAKLLNRYNNLFLHGRMTPAMKTTILNAVNKLAATDTLNRSKLMVNLILSSHDYQVQR